MSATTVAPRDSARSAPTNGSSPPPARIFLQPIAAPSILGLFGFAAATFMVATYLAGWYGNASTPIYLFPLAAVFGGMAQFAAGMFSFRARDALATAMHGAWGSFWIAWGILYLLVATGTLTIPAHGAFAPLAFWFLPLAAITLSGSLAALAENLGLFSVLSTLWVGAAFLGVHYLTGASGWQVAGGWVLFASAVLAWYSATAMMLESTVGRVVLPLGKWSRQANTPGQVLTRPVQFEAGQPGVRKGQ